MTATEAAIFLEVSYHYVLVLLRTGKLKGRRVNRKWVVDEEAVRARAAGVKQQVDKDNEEVRTVLR